MRSLSVIGIYSGEACYGKNHAVCTCLRVSPSLSFGTLSDSFSLSVPALGFCSLKAEAASHFPLVDRRTGPVATVRRTRTTAVDPLFRMRHLRSAATTAPGPSLCAPDNRTGVLNSIAVHSTPPVHYRTINGFLQAPSCSGMSCVLLSGWSNSFCSSAHDGDKALPVDTPNSESSCHSAQSAELQPSVSIVSKVQTAALTVTPPTATSPENVAFSSRGDDSCHETANTVSSQGSSSDSAPLPVSSDNLFPSDSSTPSQPSSSVSSAVSDVSMVASHVIPTHHFTVTVPPFHPPPLPTKSIASSAASVSPSDRPASESLDAAPTSPDPSSSRESSDSDANTTTMRSPSSTATSTTSSSSSSNETAVAAAPCEADAGSPVPSPVHLASPLASSRSAGTACPAGGGQVIVVKDKQDAVVVVAESEIDRKRAHRNRAMKPKELVAHLDKYIIGQPEAKRAVANALRNRWRRQQLEDEGLRDDIVPKNILMIGPTGVGKTEIARRLSKVVDAPFIKVEATKFTEVGFHGRDVDQIIKDLVEVAVKQQKSKTESEFRAKAEETAESSILETLLGKLSREDKQSWLGHLRMGLLDDRIIQVDVPLNFGAQPNSVPGGTSLSSDAIDAIAEAVSSLSAKPFKVVQGRGSVERKSLSVKEAKQLLVQAQLDAMINQETIVKKALESAEQEGIVFVDEIDKICTKGHGGYTGPDASAEGVQRDLLPLIEGSSVATKYGNVKTDYILFVASGAFHSVKPSDMLAELQGRLPVRVELKPLTTEDFVNILKTPKHNLILQNRELLATEGIDLHFTEDAIAEIARVSSEVNTHIENIGARRLHTIIEKIMEDINFEAPNMEPGDRVVVDFKRVQATVVDYLQKTDLHKFIL
eukprot:GHVQ01014398.1.p1 GENE.GHVQ01014398.1~~GHVQ01014398.1.p1  ORF type:complete len:877 (+),score=149.30 GHVQ01014398.1:556-3186(+)